MREVERVKPPKTQQEKRACNARKKVRAEMDGVGTGWRLAVGGWLPKASDGKVRPRAPKLMQQHNCPNGAKSISKNGTCD